MVRDSLTAADSERVDIVSVADDDDDSQWKQNVKGKVLGSAKRRKLDIRNIAILGYLRDESSYYLEMFPEWQFVALPEYQDITATGIRYHYFLTGDIRSVTRPVADKLRKFRRSQAYQNIANALCEQSPACVSASDTLRN